MAKATKTRPRSTRSKSQRVGYARVSTATQNLDSQLDALRAAGCSRVFEDTISGTSKERPGWDAFLGYARAGDTLVITELSRMSRSLLHLLQVVADLEEREIGIVSLRESIDTTTATGRLFLSVMGAISQMERELRAERAAAGRAAARARGRSGGRPRTPRDKLEKARRLYDSETMTAAEASAAAGVSRRALFRYLAELRQKAKATAPSSSSSKQLPRPRRTSSAAPRSPSPTKGESAKERARMRAAMRAGTPPPLRLFQGGDGARYWRNFVVRRAKTAGWEVVQYRTSAGVPVVIDGGSYEVFLRMKHDGQPVGTVRTLRDARLLLRFGRAVRFFLADGYGKRGPKLALLNSFPKVYGWRCFTVRPATDASGFWPEAWDLHAFRDQGGAPLDVTRYTRRHPKLQAPPWPDDPGAEHIGTFASLRVVRSILIEINHAWTQPDDHFVHGLSSDEREELDEWWRVYESELAWSDS